MQKKIFLKITIQVLKDYIGVEVDADKGVMMVLKKIGDWER